MTTKNVTSQHAKNKTRQLIHRSTGADTISSKQNTKALARSMVNANVAIGSKQIAASAPYSRAMSIIFVRTCVIKDDNKTRTHLELAVWVLT